MVKINNFVKTKILLSVLMTILISAGVVWAADTIISSSGLISLVAGGSNQNVNLTPSGTGTVNIGGDSIVVASKSIDPTSPSAGQIYFNSTQNEFKGFDGTDWIQFGSGFSYTPHTVTASGSAQIDTAQSKFGGASGLFDGTGDYIWTPYSGDWYFGADDFTIDFWIRPNGSQNDYDTLWHQQTDSPQRWFAFDWGIGGKLRFIAHLDGTTVAEYSMTNAQTWTSETWYHVALVKKGLNIYMFKDGASQALTTTTGISGNLMPNVPSSVGMAGSDYRAPSYQFNGHIDEYRVSRTARWTANFTPQSSAYTVDADTVLLLHMNGTDGSTTFTDGD